MVMFYIAAVCVFVFVSFLLSVFVLAQDSGGSGAGVTFGGGDAGNSLFGTSTPKVFKNITAYLATGFLSLCFIISIWTEILGCNNKAIIDLDAVEQVKNIEDIKS